jgi:CHAT domain-containing protein/Tfp pilus assembly protein PilF
MKDQSLSAAISSPWKRLYFCRAVTCFLCLLFSLTPVITINARSVLAPAQATTDLHSTRQESAEVRRLEAGRPFERELKGGETHSYRLWLAADQYLCVTIEQRGVDVTVALFGPDGKKLAEANSAKGAQGQETLTFITDGSGDYRLEVRPADKSAAIGRYEAKIIALRAPTTEERVLEEARRLMDEARSLRQNGKYDEALGPAERALALREKVLGLEHTSVADSLHLLAVIYDDKHEYAKAEPPNLRALAIREKALGPDHPDVARSLFNLAWLSKVKQDFANAESLYRRALAIQERALGPDHPDVATTLNDLAVLYNQKGDYDQSILVNERVLKIREKALGPDDTGVAKALNNLARVYENKGEYGQAESLLQRSLLIWERALGADHPEVAFAVDGLAKVYSFKGDYAKAEPLYLRALAIREKALGPNHPEVGTTLNNLGVLYRQKGDYAKAEPLHLRDLAITEKALGPDHRFVAPTLINLAEVYKQQGDDAKAEPLYLRALAIREKALGPNHPDVGVALNNLGQLYLRNKKGEAEPLLRRSLAILEKALGLEHHRVASPLGGLAALLASKGEQAQADSLYRRALAIQEKAVGPEHPEVAQSLENLAKLYRAKGDVQQALALLARSHEIRERHLHHNLALGSERQKLDYLKLFAEETDRALSLHARLAPRDTRAVHLALTTILRRKGRALDATSDSVAVLRSRAIPQDQELFGRLSDARSQLAALTLKGPGGTNVAAYRSQLRRLDEELERLEAEVSARSAEFRAQSRAITLEAVQSVIPDGAVLIEFALYRPDDARSAVQSPPRYAAYLLSHQGPAQWVELGEAAQIDRAVEDWRRALRNPERADVRRLARSVDARVMQPVRALLGSSQHLLISPDGPLNLIPFAAMVDEQSRYLAERYTVTYLTSGRDLLRLEVARASKSRSVIVADPAFGEPALVASNGETGQRHRQGRASSRPRVDYSQVFFGPLPGVSDEVRALKGLLPEATFLLKEEATETALKRVSGPSLLHIATHGFFLQDGPNPVAAVAGGTRLGKWAAQAENPLLRSGLALAGANQGRSGEDDGVLTALEAGGLNLWGTRLVVLSACDTGVGEVRNGDGVYGLRRALVLAGAESQMMSLWPVSDRSTRDLMAGYYRRLIEGQGRGEALRQAQLEMLRSKSRAHPYYWASFILSGEWANLEGRR